MLACKTFTPRLISALAAFSLASFFLCSCGDDKAKTITPTEPTSEEPAKEGPTPADSTVETPKDTLPSDTTPTVEPLHTITGYVNRGQYQVGAEVVLRELDSSLAQTGVVYRSAIADSLGSFIIPDVKLTQPYVHIEVLGRFNSVCYESNYNGGDFIGATEAYADVRKGDTINLNVLTHMQARRLPRYMDNGLSFDSAMSTLQSEISALLMLDTLYRDFNKLNLVTKQDEGSYLLGATILSEANLYSSTSFDDLLSEDSLTDSTASSLWYQAYIASSGKDCWKITEYARKYGYLFTIPGAKKYLNQIWKVKYDLGECTADNQYEIKSAAFSSKYRMYCDSANWNSGYCTDFDMIALNSSETDTTAGHLAKGAYCENVYYYWERKSWSTNTWFKASEIEVKLKLACVDGTKGLYGKIDDQCYYCTGRDWDEKEMTECEEHIVSVGTIE